MAFSLSQPGPKLWPSQRKNYFGWSNTGESVSTLGTPPMGISASRLQAHLNKTRGPTHEEKNERPRTPQPQLPHESEYHENYERATTNDSFSAWNVKQLRHSFQNTYRALKDYEVGGDETHYAPETTVADVATTYKSVLPTTTSNIRPRTPLKFKLPKTVRISQGTDAASRKELVHLPLFHEERTSFLQEINKELTEADFSRLSSATKEECEMVKRLCAQALSKRRKALDFYTSTNDRLNQDSLARAQAYEPEVYKIPLCDLMLDLLTERDALLKKRAEKYCQSGPTPSSPCAMGKNREVPVYCLDGVTLLGKPHDSGLFRNTYAKLSSLIKVKDDPEDYERYVATADMRGFDDDQILIHACGNNLRFDGCAVDYEVGVGQRQRRVTENIELPEGVYPDRLRIARGDDGIFVIQEPWKF